MPRIKNHTLAVELHGLIVARSNDGTLINGPTVDSANGGGIDFDGTDDYTDFGNILNVGTGDIWFSWVGNKRIGGDGDRK